VLSLIILLFLSCMGEGIKNGSGHVAAPITVGSGVQVFYQVPARAPREEPAVWQPFSIHHDALGGPYNITSASYRAGRGGDGLVSYWLTGALAHQVRREAA